MAIKLLDVLALSPATTQRFARERDTLARLQHPNIARLLDAGLDERGTPFLVMDYVDGAPIDQHCQDVAASLEARLAIIRQVCLAVEYAHSQLIVHRDLKPANVLVDRFGNVRLLDFGIAKWLDDPGDGASRTQTAQRVLTPAHAAPEQFRGDAVTAATDVYQLGLLLYRLLTGRQAHASAEASVAQLRRAVLETDPHPPSRMAADVAWRRRLVGDLDAIVLKALRPEPADRYPTVEALRRDLDDHRDHRPVAARRGSRAYVVRKYVWRHRTAAAAVLAVVLSSTVGLVAVSSQARLLTAERDRARAAEAKASAINAFLVDDLLAAATPERARGVVPTVDVYLDLAARTVGQAFETQPDVAAEIQLALARSYASLGRLASAGEHAASAVALLSKTPAAGRRAALRARSVVAELAIEDGRYAEARAELEGMLAEQQVVAGPTDPDTLRTRALLARASRRLGDVAGAEREVRPVVDLAVRLHPSDRRLGIDVRGVLVDVLNAQSRTGEAEALLEQMIALAREHYGEAHPRTIDVLGLRASVLTTALKYREAIDAHQDLVALSEQVYGPDHPATARGYAGLAVAISRVHGNAADLALPPITRAHDIFRRAFGDDHPDTLQALRNLGIWNRYRKNLGEAERLAQLVYEGRRRTLGDQHRSTLEAGRSLAALLVETGRRDEASRLGRRLLEQFEAVAAQERADPLLIDDYALFLLEGQPPEVRDDVRAAEMAARAVDATSRRDHLRLRTLARAQLALGQTEAAIASLDEALRLPDAIVSWTQEEMLVDLMRVHRPPAALEAWLLERLDRYARDGRREDFAVARTLRHLAQFYARARLHEDAERRFREALAQMRKTVDDGHFEVGRVRVELGEVLAARGATAEGEAEIVAGAEAFLADYRVGPRARADVRDRVVVFYESVGATDKARQWRGRPLQRDASR